MDTNIISSIIETVGTVVAAGFGAFIAGGYISKVFKHDIVPKFQKYADKDHDVSTIMNKAIESIYIIVSIGDNLLDKHEDDFKSYLKSGVMLKFIIHDETKYYELENFINGDVDANKGKYSKTREDTLDKLRQLRQEYENLVEIREFNSILTVSYIGVDMESDGDTWRRSAVIQMVPYQYRVKARNNPIIRITPKENPAHFRTVKKSMTEIWKNGKPFK